MFLIKLTVFWGIGLCRRWLIPSPTIYINFYHETNAIEGSALEHKHLVPKKGKAFRDTATLLDF